MAGHGLGDGLEGGMANRKHAGIAHVSRAVAQRELANLLERGFCARINKVEEASAAASAGKILPAEANKSAQVTQILSRINLLGTDLMAKATDVQADGLILS